MGRSRVGGPVAIASGAARDTTPSRDGAVGRLGSAPRNNRSRAHYEVRCGTRPLMFACRGALSLAGGGAGDPQARMSGVDAGDKNRDAKTDGRSPVTGRSPLRGTPGDRQKLKNYSGGLAASRVPPLGFRWCAYPAGRSASQPPGAVRAPRG